MTVVAVLPDQHLRCPEAQRAFGLSVGPDIAHFGRTATMTGTSVGFARHVAEKTKYKPFPSIRAAASRHPMARRTGRSGIPVPAAFRGCDRAEGAECDCPAAGSLRPEPSVEQVRAALQRHPEHEHEGDPRREKCTPAETKPRDLPLQSGQLGRGPAGIVFHPRHLLQRGLDLPRRPVLRRRARLTEPRPGPQAARPTDPDPPASPAPAGPPPPRAADPPPPRATPRSPPAPLPASPPAPPEAPDHRPAGSPDDPAQTVPCLPRSCPDLSNPPHSNRPSRSSAGGASSRRAGRPPRGKAPPPARGPRRGPPPVPPSARRAGRNAPSHATTPRTEPPPAPACRAPAAPPPHPPQPETGSREPPPEAPAARPRQAPSPARPRHRRARQDPPGSDPSEDPGDRPCAGPPPIPCPSPRYR